MVETKRKLLNYLKCMFRTITVTKIDRVTRIIVNSKYFPIRGTTKLVGGMSSASKRKNTVKESKMLTHLKYSSEKIF